MWKGWRSTLAIALGYTAIAIPSLEIASIHISSSPVWPPSGLAIGLLAVLGLRHWPAVLVGAFAANFWNTQGADIELGVAIGSSATIAIGNTIEALVGGYLAGKIGRLRRLRSVGLLSAAAAAGATISAGIGVVSLLVWQLLDVAFWAPVFQTWWLGNVAGTLIVAPLILGWHKPGAQEIGLLVASAAAMIIGFKSSGWGLMLILPVVFWAMYHGSRLAMPMVVLGGATGGVAMTRLRAGPFWSGDANEALLLLQVLLIFLALCGPVIAAARQAAGSLRIGIPWALATTLVMLPLLAGAGFIGDTYQPSLADLEAARLEERHAEVSADWESLIHEQDTQIRTLRAFLQSSNVTTGSFEQFVIDAGWEFGPGKTTALGYAPLVTQAELIDFEASVRNDTELPEPVRTAFSVFPPTEAPIMSPIRWVYPMDPEPGAIGFDLRADPRHEVPLALSSQTGKPEASAPIPIVRPGGNDTGVTLAMAVFIDGKLAGHAVAALALPNATSGPAAPSQTTYRIVDVTDGETTLYATGDGAWSTSRPLDAWGRNWRIDFDIAELSTVTERAAPWFIMAAGGAISVAIGMIVYAYAGIRDRAMRLSEEMLGKIRHEEQQAATIRQLEDLDAFRTRFLNMASHELRTPLLPILAHTHILALTATEAQRPSIGMIERGAKRLNAMVDDLLMASRAEAGQLTLELAEIDLAEVTRASVDAHRQSAEQANVRVNLQTHPTPVVADGDRMAQIVDNLMTNAIKFAPGGTVDVSVSDDHGPTIRVHDNGKGIDEDTLPIIGQPFVQAADSEGGSGLGLHICKTLAELHGGSLTVESEGIGKGTTITLRIARKTEPSHPESDAEE